MGFYNGVTTFPEVVAIIIHILSVICDALVIYLTLHRNQLVSLFAFANIGQHLSKLFRLVIFGFSMTNSPTWSCFVHAITNFLTVGMEAYIAMLFAMRLWLMITKKNPFKLLLLRNTEILTYVCGFGIPSVLSLFSIFPQIIESMQHKFIIPPEAENCITGYRHNAWQIILSGPGTTLPPFLLSAGFGIHIGIVICTVSTQNIMKDVKKFSTISYSSWIRMLWFGIFFCVVVVLNITSDITNAKKMSNNGTPEPGVHNIGIAYYITAAVGMGILLIFGTTAEAKKKISSLIKSSIHGLSSSVTLSKRSQSQSQSQIKSQNQSQDMSSYSLNSNPFGSNINIKIEPSKSNLTKSISLDSDMVPMTNIKNSGLKPKRDIGDLEATMEFNKFMKSINDSVKTDDNNSENSFLNNKHKATFYSSDGNLYNTRSNTFDSDPYTNHPLPPPHRQLNNITPRMMVPIQKYSHQRMQQQLLINQLQQYQINHNNSMDSFDDIRRDFSESEMSTKYSHDSHDSVNNLAYMKINDEDEDYDVPSKFVRDATYTEEIIYPAKASVSVKIKQTK
ncbi:hypothetical protein BCR32DRAFT_270570 [Anaeromyces robustus]|uniref:Uncharacterized protein n=1 Tax=Anaeromyces robustus TaxID=1754192 RepID=A0A1Y1WWU6_9FUNG|nr:hypothetical protein BCR32DRAFT_270570 [Anaeromyces robustus]|eukprot:ORX77604.1 hypothetical protein BCR32DRAFT_270570 [Anaeromyces robustus]